MARVFSGIQPTGEMHLGNYVGAVRRWVDEQPPPGSAAAAAHEAIFCVVDLHAMTMAFDPEDLRTRTREVATLLFAAGLDPRRSLVFVQSHVGGVHAEGTWILNCVATFGELRRMTQFKEKSEGQDSVTAGLFDYPVLMASDILLYDTAEVPVGDDQRQHVELTRDIALRFNHRFGDTFVVPKATFPAVGARVMDLQQPTAKMSKSSDSPQGTVLVLDPPESVVKKVRSAVTDSDSEIRYDPEAKPGVSSLLDLYSAATGIGRDDAVAAFAGSGYGALKSTVADALVEYLRPLRERHAELARDPGEVDRMLAEGADAAEAISTGVLERVRNAVGLLPRLKG
jgi:tryptophanyl-tRNA synthetase